MITNSFEELWRSMKGSFLQLWLERQGWGGIPRRPRTLGLGLGLVLVLCLGLVLILGLVLVLVLVLGLSWSWSWALDWRGSRR